jgi:hypothetical protein
MIYVDSTQSGRETRHLIQSAIEAEISRLELAVKNAQKRLAFFEQKYNVSSEQFITDMAAEDLNGGDDEYIQWAGEYHLTQKLKKKLNQLQGIEYGDSSTLHTSQSHH